jgi:hypothetical protein
LNRRYPRIADRAGHRCEYCLAPEAVFNFPFEVEHIIPQLHGGGDSEDNLALACRACNAHKADIVEHTDPLTGESVRLFHPRRDTWSDHFRIDTAAALIEGVSAIGRVSVDRMVMNAVEQVEARSLWFQLNLFP